MQATGLWTCSFLNFKTSVLGGVVRRFRKENQRGYRFWVLLVALCNNYTMGCPPVRGANPRALASGLSYVQVDKHGITILYHLYQCIPCTS